MIRKNLTDLSSDDLDLLADGLNDLWDQGVISANAQLHNDNFWSGIHWGPVFLPWHRDFLKKVEQGLQDFNSDITLPYWDWTKENSRNIDNEPWKSFLGGRDNTGGNFDHWSYGRNNSAEGNVLPSLNNIIMELNQSSYLDFRALETGSHVPGHTWTGDTMASGESPLDPLFYFHHCNLDRLWSIWQLNNSDRVQYEHLGELGSDISIDEVRVPMDMPMIGGATPESMLDHSALNYTYDQDVALEEAWFAIHGTNLITHIDTAIA